MTGAQCAHCGAALSPAARFCNKCGEPVRELPARLPWVIAGVAVVGLIAALVIPRLGSSSPAGSTTFNAPFVSQPSDSGATEPAGMGTPPPLTGTPRQQADRLFNHIMTLKQSGNTQQVDFFLPMGIQAYEQAGTLDADGLYHLSLLQNLAGQSADALATAKQVLAKQPDHLLALAAAAEAATKQGDKTQADAFWTRFLASYNKQVADSLPEYKEHAAALPGYKAEAQKALGR